MAIESPVTVASSEATLLVTAVTSVTMAAMSAV
jgi:hypothetical protein